MAELKTVDIKGTPYVTVATRIVYFRENYPGASIITEMIGCDEKACTFKASIVNENGKIVSTGHAYEVNGSNYINKTSYIENCETSAVGRALGNFGIGTEAAVASADEVLNARLNHDAKKQEVSKKIDTSSKQELIRKIVAEIKNEKAVTGSESLKKLIVFLERYAGPEKYVRACVDTLKIWINNDDKVNNMGHVVSAFQQLPDVRAINVDNLDEIATIKKYAANLPVV